VQSDVAAADQLRYLTPFDLSCFQAKRDPSWRPNLREQIKPGGSAAFARQRLACAGPSAIAMMVVQQIREGLLAHQNAVCRPVTRRTAWDGKYDLR